MPARLCSHLRDTFFTRKPMLQFASFDKSLTKNNDGKTQVVWQKKKWEWNTGSWLARGKTAPSQLSFVRDPSRGYRVWSYPAKTQWNLKKMLISFNRWTLPFCVLNYFFLQKKNHCLKATIFKNEIRYSPKSEEIINFNTNFENLSFSFSSKNGYRKMIWRICVRTLYF